MSPSATAGSPRSARPTTPRPWTVSRGRGHHNGIGPTPTDFVIGPETEVIAGNGRILTAGGDRHPRPLHLPRPGRRGAGRGRHHPHRRRHGPGEGSKATTVTPGAWHLARMFEALDAFPVNIGLLGKGNTMSQEAMLDQVEAGVIGFKIHEDWGATPAVIDNCLDVCEQTGVQLALHADSLNEAGFVADTLAAIAGRSIHVFHIEGAGGGHAPDIITMVSEPNVLPSSTNPTRPLTVNTVKEHLDMLMVCHHLNPEVPEDLAFAESRIRPSTIAAEDILHDLGAISIISSDSQAMGRIGEMIMRTWQTAHVMKVRRGFLEGDLPEGERPTTPDKGRPTTAAPAATSPNTPSTRRSPRASTPRSARWRPASSPTWCCGSRRSSASSRTWSSRAGRSRTRRWATPTPPSPPRSRSCPGRCAARRAGPRRQLVQLRHPTRAIDRTVCPNGSALGKRFRAISEHAQGDQGATCGRTTPPPGRDRPRHLRGRSSGGAKVDGCDDCVDDRPSTAAYAPNSPWPSGTSSSEP